MAANGPFDVYNLILNVTLFKSTETWREDMANNSISVNGAQIRRLNY